MSGLQKIPTALPHFPNSNSSLPQLRIWSQTTQQRFHSDTDVPGTMSIRKHRRAVDISGRYMQCAGTIQLDFVASEAPPAWSPRSCGHRYRPCQACLSVQQNRLRLQETSEFTQSHNLPRGQLVAIVLRHPGCRLQAQKRSKVFANASPQLTSGLLAYKPLGCLGG